MERSISYHRNDTIFFLLNEKHQHFICQSQTRDESTLETSNFSNNTFGISFSVQEILRITSRIFNLSGDILSGLDEGSYIY